MRKYLFILLLLLSCSTIGLGQQYIARLNTDSLESLLKIAKDTQRINTLNLFATRVLYGNAEEGGTSKARQLAGEALRLSRHLKYKKGLGEAILNEAIIRLNSGIGWNNMLGDLDSALVLLKKSDNPFYTAACYARIGQCYHGLGKNNEAIRYFDSAVTVFQRVGDTVTSVWTMIDLAHSYSDLGNFPASYKSFHTAQTLTPVTDTMLLCFGWYKISMLFVWANLPEIAIEYWNKLRSFYNTFSPQQQKNLKWSMQATARSAGEAFLQLHQVDSAQKIASYLNSPLAEQGPPENLFYGHLYAAMGDYKKALIYFERGYHTSKETSYEIGHALHANGLADAFLHLNDYTNAINYANEAIETSKKMQSLTEQKNAMGILSEAYAATKNYDKAYYYNQQYKLLNDSLAPEDYKRKLSLVQVKDQLELQKKEADLLNNQNQLSQQQIQIQESALKRRSLLLYIALAVITAMVLLAVLISRNIKLKKRKTELQQLMEQVNAHQRITEMEKEKTQLEMQALRAQMNPHFIFNCLSSINRFILINKIDEASDYLTKFSRLIRMALHHSEKPLIPLENDLEALRLYLELERLRFKNAFNYNITFTNDIDSNAVYIPPMLIQPFVENAIWHGLMHKKGTGRLDIQLCTTGKILTCTITDDGIGRDMAARVKSRSAEKNKSMGVNITAGRLALLNKSGNEATVFETEDIVDEQGNACGTRVVLAIPYKALTEVEV